MSKLNQRQRSKRAALTLPAIVCVNADTYPASILDLSSSGFRIECAAKLKPGDRIELQVGKDFVSGQIRWANNAEAGGEFDIAVVVRD